MIIVATDFLKSFNQNDSTVKEKSPYKLGKKETKAIRIRKDTWKALSYIALDEDTKIIDIAEDMIAIARKDPKYKKFDKFFK